MRRRRRRPDLLFVLAVLLGLSILVTGFTQQLYHPREEAIHLTQQ